FSTTLRDSTCKHPVQFVGIEADHDLFAHNDGWGRAAVVFADQLEDRLLINADIFYIKRNASRREVGLSPITRRSPWHGEDHNFLGRHIGSWLTITPQCSHNPKTKTL